MSRYREGLPKHEGSRTKREVRQIKRKEAMERLDYWQSLSPKQQLDALDHRLGKGVGAKKQRAKIKEKIDA